ncbi:MAG: GNAT family N-acetyltransferase, partial [Bacillota bacterium]
LAGAVEIRHLAVAPGRRGRGLGREMVFALPTVCTCLDVVAETDHDAVGFYRRIGFSLESLGELYPGTERFRCRLRLPEAWRQD